MTSAICPSRRLGSGARFAALCRRTSIRGAALVGLLIVFAWLPPSSAAEDSGGERARESAPRRLLLIGHQPDGHPPGTHEYLPAQAILAAILEKTPGVTTQAVQADDPWTVGPELLNEVDGVVLFATEGARWIQTDPRRLQALVRLADRGGALIVLHWGMGAREAQFVPQFTRLFGGCHGGPDRKYQVVETTLTPADHPIATGLRPFEIHDEFYYRLKWAEPAEAVQPVLKARIDGEDHAVAWAYQRPGGGRSFGFSGLHFHAGWGREEYRRLVGQGILWSLNLPIPEQGLDVSWEPQRAAALLRLPAVSD